MTAQRDDDGGVFEPLSHGAVSPAHTFEEPRAEFVGRLDLRHERHGGQRQHRQRQPAPGPHPSPSSARSRRRLLRGRGHSRDVAVREPVMVAEGLRADDVPAG